MYGKNKILFSYDPYPFCAYFERYMLWVIKDKICIFKIQNTFVLCHICQKCQGTQIKAFLCFGIKERDVALCIPPSIRCIKTLLFEYLDIFCICVINQKCLVFSKYRFYLLWLQPFFVRILGDSIYLKKGRDHKK